MIQKIEILILGCLCLFFCAPQHSVANNQDSLLQILATVQSPLEKIRIHQQIAEANAKSDLVQSVRHGMEAYRIAETIKNDTLVAEIAFKLNTYFFYQGMYDQAIFYIDRYYRYYMSTGNKAKAIFALPSMGALQDRTNNNDQAEKYYLEALQLFDEMKQQVPEDKYQRAILVLHNNLGGIYYKKKMSQISFSYYMKGLAKAEEWHNNEYIGYMCHNIGKMYMESGNLDSAIMYLTRAYDERKKIGQKYGLSTSSTMIANYYIKQKNYPQAIAYANQALQYSIELGALEPQMYAHQTFVDIYTSLNDFKQAFEHQKQVQTIKDSLDNVQQSNAVTRSQMQLEFELKQYQYEQEQREKETKYIFIAILLVLFLALISTLYFLLRTRYRSLNLQQKTLELEKKQLEADLDTKNKELATNVMYLVKKNELIADVLKRLLESRNDLKDENKAMVNQITNDLKNELDNGVWDEFEMRFQQVHTAFYEKLQKQFPDLTPNEIKLCAFLRLNMTTKEIAAITNQSAKAIEVARYRLRKKLNISNTDANLVNFLMEL